MGKRVLLFNCEDAEKWRDSWGIWQSIMSKRSTEDTYIVHNMYELEQQPRVDEVAAAGLVIISGSHYSAYEDLPWINRMVELLPQYVATGARIVACCFGHQVMSRALGGKVERNPSGRFVLGVERIRLRREALEACGLLQPFADGLPPPPTTSTSTAGASAPDAPSTSQARQASQAAGPSTAGADDASEWSMLQVESHGDCVTVLPPGAVLLADSASASYEMYCWGSNVLSFQFHPELACGVVLEKIYPAVGPSGARKLTEEEAAASYAQLTTAKPQSDVVIAAIHHFADHGCRAPAAAEAAAASAPQPQPQLQQEHPVHGALSAVVGHTREALQSGLAQAALQCGQLAQMNGVAAQQYGDAAEAAEKLADRTADLKVRVGPVHKTLGGLAALEAQVEALGAVVEALELESVVLARQVGASE
mmetsp:Transcript_9976/g.24930  ORF Transcript_9976/g.24930 Transcript_9976/m.24930 type:complete len:422 (-) Transcript_9976:13-1278(-)